jgi:hypothetical protein
MKSLTAEQRQKAIRAKSACVKWAGRNGFSCCEIVENLEV